MSVKHSSPTELRAVLKQAVDAHSAGLLEQARVLYEAILERDPRHFDALHLSGVVALQSGNPRLALERIEAARIQHPTNAAANANRGSAFEALRDWEHALASFEAAIALQPDFVEAHFNKGNVLVAMGRPAAALASYDRAATLRPTLTEAFFNRGNVLRGLGRTEEAVASFDRALALRPRHAETWLNRGLALKEARRWQEALDSYERALQAKPDYPEAHSNRGNVLKALERWEEALAEYDRAIALNADLAEAHFNRGTVLQELGRYEAAIDAHGRALALKPRYADAHLNLGNALLEAGQPTAALEHYDRAVELRPDFAAAHFSRAVGRLLAGELERGFTDYEWRWRNPEGSVINERREFEAPLWLGDADLAGSTILLHAEQGLGDTLQFVRYAPHVAERGARVLLEVKRPLIPLLAGFPGVSRLIERGSSLPPFDWHCPLMSLPLAFRTRVDSIPATPYLRTDPALVRIWQTRLGRATGPRIGLAWSGNPLQRSDRKRSIPLAQWLPSLPPGPQYVCLQTPVRDADRPALAMRRDILNFGEALGFDAAAAVCTSLDLVIAVDTSIAHLSAALGIPTWVLLPYVPDWRWLLDRDDSPWYPSVTLFRQTRRGDWADVFERVRQRLVSEFFSRASGQ
jgi:tetratricopeptide (TPR) repeat protein